MKRLLLATVALFAAVVFSSCSSDRYAEASRVTGGDPAKGKQAIEYYGCATCHTIPGIPDARGKVGPSLAGVAGRNYIGGAVPNTPENMSRWIRDPKVGDKPTAMPHVGVSEAAARDITGYLYTLK